MWSRIQRNDSNDGFTGLRDSKNDSTWQSIPATTTNNDKRTSLRTAPVTSSSQYHTYSQNRQAASNGEGASLVTANTPSAVSARAKLPPLDLTNASLGEKVTYDDSKAGPSNMPVPIVRTGGISVSRR